MRCACQAGRFLRCIKTLKRGENAKRNLSLFLNQLPLAILRPPARRSPKFGNSLFFFSGKTAGPCFAAFQTPKPAKSDGGGILLWFRWRLRGGLACSLLNHRKCGFVYVFA